MSRRDQSIISRGKMLAGAMAFGIVLSLGQISAAAAGTVSVSTTKSSAAVSEQVSVAVQTSEPEDPASPPEISVSYDPAVLQFDSCDVEYGGGEGGLVTIRGTAGTLNFTTLTEGTTNVSAEAVIDDDGNNPATGQTTITVGGGGPVAAAATGGGSADATLRGIQINPGVLSPAFSPNVTNYTITIDEGVTDISVSSGVTDPEAKITSANGFKNLEEGENDAQILVTAADGSTLTYTFHIVRGDTQAAAQAVEDTQPVAESEAPAETESVAVDTTGSLQAGASIGGGFSKGNDMTILVGSNSYTIQPVVNDELIPSGGSKTTATYASQSIEVVALGSLVLVDARSNVDGSEKLFIYDAQSDSFQGFIKIDSQNGDYIIPLALPKDLPKGFVADGAELGGVYVACGKFKDSSVEQRENVCLLYAAGPDGSQGYYLYDISGGGYVHFLNYASGSGSAFGTRGLPMIILLAVLLLISLIIMLVMAVNKVDYVQEEPKEPEKKAPKKSPETEREQGGVRTVKKPRPKTVYEEEEQRMTERPRTVRKKTVEPEKKPVAPVENGEGAPVTTVKKVKKKRPVSDEIQDGGDDFDVSKEIENMKENAAKKTATARMENMEAALRTRSTTRTVMPEKKSVREEMARKPESVKVKKSSRPVRSEEITVDKPVRKPAARTAKTVRDESSPAEEGSRPRVTRTVTDRGVTYTTGKIPITVVKSTKPSGEGNNSNVPIFTLGKESGSLSRESRPGAPDTDFKFDFIDVDKDGE